MTRGPARSNSTFEGPALPFSPRDPLHPAETGTGDPGFGMVFDYTPPVRSELYARVMSTRDREESVLVQEMLAAASFPEETADRIRERSTRLVRTVHRRSRFRGPEAFLNEYSLTGPEGAALMSLAESALRTPDDATLDRLIRDKVADGDWAAHAGHSGSPLVNASTRAFMLAAAMLQTRGAGRDGMREHIRSLRDGTGRWLVRQGVRAALNLAGRHFILGNTIGQGLARGRRYLRRGYTLSFDMLGEAALTDEQATGNFRRYVEAISAISAPAAEGPAGRYGISVKLSAITPRLSLARYQEALGKLVPRMRSLALRARDAGIGLTLDAEETQRLELQLDVLSALMRDPLLRDYEGLGVAVQTYQKRAWPLIDWLASQARDRRRRLMVRLTKGAYWDAEVRAAQLAGLDSYPVFTRKASTDVSFIACAQKLLSQNDRLYPMFATHNAHTVASILEIAGNSDYEFQRLHGMGGALFDRIVGGNAGVKCRVYAPCGDYASLLPYLVRRLLENGANTSFVHRVADSAAPVEDLTRDPATAVRELETIPNPGIPLPGELFEPERRNSRGIELSSERALRSLAGELQPWTGHIWGAAPLIDGHARPGPTYEARNPADHRRKVGVVTLATGEDIELAVTRAKASAATWSGTPAAARAECLERAGDLFEANRTELIALCVCEAGKTIENAVAEVREAVDFCRYYAARAREGLCAPRELPGTPNGTVTDRATGTFACISPWNFPLAIFTGQVAAALAAGNSVVAKPAEQTPLIAMRAVMLMHDAGVPEPVLHLLTGAGETGARLVSDPRIDGVAFTGGANTARQIRNALAAAHRRGIASLIAETGGQNAMIVDSTARLEQAVVDAVRSAFDSAGQRCSALRVLYVQEEIAEEFEDLLTGAMAQLKVGDPAWIGTDVGPVIDADAERRLQVHTDWLEANARRLHCCGVGPECRHGSYFAPRAYEIESLDQLSVEHFGPVLHVVRYAAKDLDRIVAQINGSGYGLTFGLQTRIDGVVRELYDKVRAGNHYVNRNMIGAVVGSQPFGGEGLSGTGPKAGGPHYLARFTRPVAKGSAWRMATTRPAVVRSGSPAADEDAGAGSPDGRRAVGRAARAASACDALDVSVRRKFLEKCAARLADRAGDIARVLATGIDAPTERVREWLEQAHALCLAWGIRAEAECSEGRELRGSTGERNRYWLHNRGAVLCIVEPRVAAPLVPAMLAAALASGNAVVFVPLPGARSSMKDVFDCFRAAPWPEHMLTMVPVETGEDLEQMLKHPKLAAVAWAGGAETAIRLERTLAERPGPLVPLIADVPPSGEVGPFSDPASLYRLCTARTQSIDTTATGGDASLYSAD